METNESKRADAKIGYNERLFGSKGLRSYFHNSRFEWFEKTCDDHLPDKARVFELGCFDGRLIQYIPFKLVEYLGYDAGWEGGLADAKKQFSGTPKFRFVESVSARDMQCIRAESFDVCVAMETLEHLPPGAVDEYLKQINRICSGYFIVSVPNEKGMMFLCKYLVKRIFFRDAQTYTFEEVVSATLGRMDKVVRDDHKGFDYSSLILQIERYFDIRAIESIPFSWMPRWCGFTIGVLACKRE